MMESRVPIIVVMSNEGSTDSESNDRHKEDECEEDRVTDSDGAVGHHGCEGGAERCGEMVSRLNGVL